MTDNKCVCLLGVDGSGKTTIAKAYIKYLEKEDIPVIHVWSRYRNYLSKPFLALMRFTGHNRKENINGISIGYHDFQNSRVIAFLFLALQWLDQIIDICLRFRITNNSIVSDRCVIDTLVDLCVDTNMDDFVLSGYGRSLIAMMPKRTTYFIVSRDKELVYDLRPDVKVDRYYDRRVGLYNRIANDFCLNMLCNNGTVGEAVNLMNAKAN